MKRKENRAERQQKRGKYGWFKIALITAAVMGTLWILVLRAPWFFGNEETVWDVFVFALLLPGALAFVLPALAVTNVHNVWPGCFVLGAILNWLFYSQVAFEIISHRRRKQEACLPPPEPETFSYTDRWQNQARGTKP